MSVFLRRLHGDPTVSYLLLLMERFVRAGERLPAKRRSNEMGGSILNPMLASSLCQYYLSRTETSIDLVEIGADLLDQRLGSADSFRLAQPISFVFDPQVAAIAGVENDPEQTRVVELGLIALVIEIV